MFDNPVPEDLVSFAGATIANSSDDDDDAFPITVHVPFGNAKQWSWRETRLGRFLRNVYAMADPEKPDEWTFVSADEGHYYTSGFTTDTPGIWANSDMSLYRLKDGCDIKYGKFACDPSACRTLANINLTCAQLIESYPDDMWMQPTTFSQYSLVPDTTYTLKRIVYADGTAPPVFWAEFLKLTHPGDHLLCEPNDWASWAFGRQQRSCLAANPGDALFLSYESNSWCPRLESTFFYWALPKRVLHWFGLPSCA